MAVAMVLAASASAWAVDATQWGSGEFDPPSLVAPNTWHYDATLTLQPIDFISSLTGDEQGNNTFKFTGMQVQIGDGSGSYFVSYLSTDLPDPPWVPGSGITYGIMGGGGKVGVTVDQDASLDVIASSATEYGYGIVLNQSTAKTVSFTFNLYIAGNVTPANMQMGWTGVQNGKYKRAQNSIDLVETPELPSVALLLSSLPFALGYLRLRCRRRTAA